MEASRHKVISGTTLGYLSPKDMNQPSSSFFSVSPTSNSSATIARELLMNGTSPTAEAIGLKGSSPTPPCSPVQPSKQLEYLARIQGFQVWIKSKNKNKKTKQFISPRSFISIHQKAHSCLLVRLLCYLHGKVLGTQRTETWAMCMCLIESFFPFSLVSLLLPGSPPFSFSCLYYYYSYF